MVTSSFGSSVNSPSTAAIRRCVKFQMPEFEIGRRLTAVAMPIQVDSLGMPAALLMIGRRNVCSPLGLEMLALRHGLTLTERRVLRALIASQSARDIADAHGVAMSTIRSQIQSIRDKVGVRSIEELLLRAAQVPPVSSWHEYRN